MEEGEGEGEGERKRERERERERGGEGEKRRGKDGKNTYKSYTLQIKNMYIRNSQYLLSVVQQPAVLTLALSRH